MIQNEQQPSRNLDVITVVILRVEIIFLKIVINYIVIQEEGSNHIFMRREKKRFSNKFGSKHVFIKTHIYTHIWNCCPET